MKSNLPDPYSVNGYVGRGEGGGGGGLVIDRLQCSLTQLNKNNKLLLFGPPN